MNPSKKATHRVTREPLCRHSKDFSPDCGRDFTLLRSFTPTGLKFTSPVAPRLFLGNSSRLWRAWRFLYNSGAWPLHSCFSFSFSFVPLRFTVRPRDVSCLQTGHVVVALPHTKTSRGRAQSVSLYDPFLCRVLPSALSQWSPDGPIIDSSLQVFRAR